MKDENGDLSYFLTDHLGSVVAITDDQGNLISQQRYLPFGGIRTNVTSPNSPNTDYGYTGQRNLDDDPSTGSGQRIGLMDYKARFYSPYLNHFTQPDSIVPDPYHPQDWDRYSYARNNPLKYTDPSGHFTCSSDRNSDDYCPGNNGSISSNGTGNRSGRDSGEAGNVTIDNPPPNIPDPSLTIPPLDGDTCPQSYTLIQCAYSGDYYAPYGTDSDIFLSNDELNQLLLAIFFDLKHREPVGGYDFGVRSVYDTPLWDEYGKFIGNVCIGSECYKRSEVNYVAQGMWAAASNQSNQEGRLGVLAWKVLSAIISPERGKYFPPIPSDGTLEWFDVGYDTYNVLNQSYPYSSP
jgi:RHS repeat-associated protein